LARSVHPEVTPEVARVALALQEELSRAGLQQALGLKDEKHFRNAYLLPALDSGLAEMTRPETPRSSKQRYRLTALGLRWLALHRGTGKAGKQEKSADLAAGAAYPRTTTRPHGTECLHAQNRHRRAGRSPLAATGCLRVWSGKPGLILLALSGSRPWCVIGRSRSLFPRDLGSILLPKSRHSF